MYETIRQDLLANASTLAEMENPNGLSHHRLLAWGLIIELKRLNGKTARAWELGEALQQQGIRRYHDEYIRRVLRTLAQAGLPIGSARSPRVGGYWWEQTHQHSGGGG